MTTLLDYLGSAFSYVGPFVLLLGLLIFVHELGHFLVAKFFGVRVEVFSLGFGKKIFSYKYGDTNYCLSWLPIGGYVKMFGDDPTATISDDQKSYSFLHKPVGPRIAIVLAGPLMNLFFAIFLYAVIALVGEQAPAPVAGDIAENSVAYSAGFRSGDKILSVKGTPVKSWTDVRSAIEGSAGKTLEFQIQHEGTEETVTVSVEPKLMPNENILSSTPMVGHIQGLETESRAAVVGITSRDSRASSSGLMTMDEFTSINGKPVKFYRDIENAFTEAVGRGESKIMIRAHTSLEDAPMERDMEIDLQGLDVNAPILPQVGIEPSELYLYKIKPDSPAAKAGLQLGDKLAKVNGIEMKHWTDVIEQVKGYTASSPHMEFVISRLGQEMIMNIKPEMTDTMTAAGKDEQRFAIGIVSGTMSTIAPPVLLKASGLLEAVKIGCTRSYEMSRSIVIGVVRLFQGEISKRNVGGVITIGRFAGKSFQMGITYFLAMMAFISVNLFLVNLLPVPVLDGGHLVFFGIEALRGSPLSVRKMEVAQQVGLVLLMSLMAFALFNDISNLFNAW